MYGESDRKQDKEQMYDEQGQREISGKREKREFEGVCETEKEKSVEM